MITRCLEQNIVTNTVHYKTLDRGPYLFREEHGPEINQYCGQYSYFLTSEGMNSVILLFFIWPPVVTHKLYCLNYK